MYALTFAMQGPCCRGRDGPVYVALAIFICMWAAAIACRKGMIGVARLGVLL